MSEIHLTEHVLVVGAGVIGLTIAWRLAVHGHSVVVLERHRPGHGATRTAGGMLGATAEVEFGEDDLLRLEKTSLRMYPDFVAELTEDAGLDPGFRDRPTLVVARDRDDVEALERVFNYQHRVGLKAQRIDADEVQNRAPYLRGIHRGVVCPSDSFVDTETLTDALVAACRTRRVELLQGAAVGSVIERKGRALGVQLRDGRKFFAEDTIVCAGAWSRHIRGIPEFDRPVLRPVRGQTVVVDGGPNELIDCVVRSPDVYLVPRSDGRIVVGSTMEEKGFDPDVTAGAVRTLLEAAWEILPAIDEQAVRALSCGFRPVSLDGRPLIGPSQLEGLHLAVGHGRHGILLAPVTGRIMARYFRAPQSSREKYRPFDPSRFAP